MLAVLAAIVVGGIAAGIIVPLQGRSARRAEQELLAHQARALQEVTNEMVAAFPEGAQIVSDFYLVYPSLADDLDQVAARELDEEEATARAEEVTRSAQASANAIEGIELVALIPQEFTAGRREGTEGPGLLLQELQDVQFLMVQAFRTYASVGNLMKAAIEARGESRRLILDQATATRQQAEELFFQAYLILAQVRARLGLESSFSGGS